MFNQQQAVMCCLLIKMLKNEINEIIQVIIIPFFYISIRV
jgi:hypothetical protein